MATGLVVAGVVGVQKPLFDTWSDTVNLASRLDTHGQVGKIHVTIITIRVQGNAFKY